MKPKPQNTKAKITNEITNKIKKLRAKDETKKITKNIEKHKKTWSWYVTGKKQKSVFTEAVV